MPDVLILILIAIVIPMTLLLGLPLLLRPDSRIPDMIGFGLLAVFVGISVWATGAWWILLPILALASWLVWLDERGQQAPAAPTAPDRAGWNARARLRFRLWCTANAATPVLVVSLFFLPAGSVTSIVLPGLMIAMAASSVFRFSFYRAARRDPDALRGEGLVPVPTSGLHQEGIGTAGEQLSSRRATGMG